MSTISPGTRQELVTAVADRYRQSTAAEKRLILDEFVALTGYHRKHAVRVLNGSAITPRARRGRRCVYDAAVTEGLIVLWEASDRMCGKRLKALLPTLVPALEHHGHLSLDPAVRERLLAVSAATIDRRLASARAVTAGQRRRRRSALNGLRGSVPVRTFGDWKDPAPGFVEADLVAHCGGGMERRSCTDGKRQEDHPRDRDRHGDRYQPRTGCRPAVPVRGSRGEAREGSTRVFEVRDEGYCVPRWAARRPTCRRATGARAAV